MVLISQAQYDKVMNVLDRVPFNTFFARSVLLGHSKGKVLTDCENNPKSYYIVSEYGMSLLLGEISEPFVQDLYAYFNGTFMKRAKPEWLQAYPRDWDTVLKPLLEKKKAVMNTRVNFKFNRDVYERNNSHVNLDEFDIRQTSAALSDNLNGLVIPKYFWANVDLYNEHCKGFTVFDNGQPASTAFSSYRYSNYLEIGIETLEAHRNKGYATIVCKALIEYCINNNLEPVWSCKLENTNSYKLAEKLGFEETLRTPYYEIKL